MDCLLLSLVAQNISRKQISVVLAHVVLVECLSTMCHDTCECVPLILTSNLLDLQKSMLASYHPSGNAILCCALSTLFIVVV